MFHKIFAISSRSTSETIGILLIGDFPICWSMSAVWFDSRKPRQNDPTFGEESAPAPQTHEILKILQCRKMKLELEQKFYWICNNSYVFCRFDHIKITCESISSLLISALLVLLYLCWIYCVMISYYQKPTNYHKPEHSRLCYEWDFQCACVT